MSKLTPAQAPYASSVRLLAHTFGASCSLRFSSRAYTGLVIVAKFHSFHEPMLPPARAFATLAARMAGYACAMRRLPQNAGFVVSVPVAPWSSLALAPTGGPAPAAAPGGKCRQPTKKGTPCRRNATYGHYCKQHAAMLGVSLTTH